MTGRRSCTYVYSGSRRAQCILSIVFMESKRRQSDLQLAFVQRLVNIESESEDRSLIDHKAFGQGVCQGVIPFEPPG